jgi:hypothetical protein
VTGGTEADLTYQWYWRGEKLVGATNKTYAFPTLTIPSATTAEELKVEVAPRTQRSDSRTRAQAEAPTPVSATLALKSSIAWNAPLGQSTWYDMAKACASQSNGNKRPGTTAELKALVGALGNMAAYGVNTANSYWTGTLGTGQGTHQRVRLNDGSETSTVDTGAGERGLCVAGTAPAAPAFGGALSNGHTFTETQFPTIGFEDAHFEFKGLKDSNANNWAYRSTDTSKAIIHNDNNWNAGVTLKAKGSANIEVYNVAGGNPNTYVVNPALWYFDSRRTDTRDDAKRYCQSMNGYLPDAVNKLTTDTPSSGGSATRSLHNLYGEWASMMTGQVIWTSEIYGSYANAAIVNMTSGLASYTNHDGYRNYACISN